MIPPGVRLCRINWTIRIGKPIHAGRALSRATVRGMVGRSPVTRHIRMFVPGVSGLLSAAW